MLKSILLSWVFLLLTWSLDAQQKFVPSTFLGINAGGGFCSVSFNPKVNEKILIGTSTGLIFRHVSEPHIGIQLEVNYAGRGWIENRDSIGTYKRNLTVLDIPVTAAFVAGSNKLRFALNLGPYVSYLLHERETISIPDTANYQNYYGKRLVNKWEFGFTGGLSVEWYTPLGAFSLRASYYHSLSNLFPLNSNTFYYAGSRTQAINAGLTYFIKL
jgi:hypothetical protein